MKRINLIVQYKNVVVVHVILILLWYFGVMQPETEQRPHKVSFYVQNDKAHEVSSALSECLVKHGVRLKLELQSFIFVSVPWHFTVISILFSFFYFL